MKDKQGFSLTNRRSLRVKVLQILYAYEMSQDPIDKVKKDVFVNELSDENQEFVDSLISQVLKNEKELDEIITVKCQNWELERISVIDRIVLRMGITELMYFPDIPPKVSINEAIDIAKEFCTRNSGKFVNGILDAVLDELKADNKLNKTGRGLIDFKKK
jgi:N utilization substance protein B